MSNENQKQIDLRALELAAGTNAVLTQHLNECRDRYLALHGFMVKAVFGLVTLLLIVIGYLIDKGGLPLHHP